VRGETILVIKAKVTDPNTAAAPWFFGKKYDAITRGEGETETAMPYDVTYGS
jgi:hypothetical protein